VRHKQLPAAVSGGCALSEAQGAATIGEVIITVDEPFRPFVDAALARLTYLYPHAAFGRHEDEIVVTATARLVDVIARDVSFILYREKIYAETLPLRRALVEAVTAR
jgi:hypothetical protein